MISTYDFYSGAVIEPPPQDTVKRNVRVVIDSRDRDTTLYPSCNSYYVDLESDIDEVVSGTIVFADVPMSKYLINVTNNKLVVDGTSVALETGVYASVEALRSALQAAIVSVVADVGITVDSKKQTFEFASDTGFTLRVPGKNNLGKIIGLAADTDYTCDGTLDAPNPVNLKPLEYIVVSVSHLSVNTSTSPVIHKSTALITSDSVKNASSIQMCITKYFNPVISSLRRLQVRCYDYYGNLYDFQNQDHIIVIQFSARKNLRRYAL